jgi:hypothetical protein
MFLSKLGYSELVQRIFEKMTFFLVDPLATTTTTTTMATTTMTATTKDDDDGDGATGYDDDDDGEGRRRRLPTAKTFASSMYLEVHTTGKA